MTPYWKKILRHEEGSEIAEAAVVLPLAFMFLLGIFWFGRAFNVAATINHAAREGARAAVAQNCGTCTQLTNTQVVQRAADAVRQALQASSLDPSQVTSAGSPTLTACGGGTASCTQATSDPKIWVCGNVLLDPVQNGTTPPTASGPPACGVAVQFQYPYQFTFPFVSLNNQRITLSANVQMKSEQ